MNLVAWATDIVAAQPLAAALVTFITLAGLIFGLVGKARTWLVSTMRGWVTKGQLIFFVAALPGHRPFWGPATIGGKPGLQVGIRLEGSNMTDRAFRIMDVQLGRRRPQSKIWGVQDPKSGMMGHDYPLPAGQITLVTVDFIFEDPPPTSTDTVLSERLTITMHDGRRISLKPQIRHVSKP